MIETAPAPLVSPSARRRPRLGFVGVGWIGRNRLEAIARSGLAEITAVSDPASGAAARAVELAPYAEISPTFDELLAMDLDGVVIATPSALHAEQSRAALQQGKAVFCQKPLARTSAETRSIIAAARTANRLLGADLSYRFTAGAQQLRELVREGHLGEIYAAEAVFHNAYGPDKGWFYDAALAGGGCLLDLGIHLVDLVLWCLDFPSVDDVAGQIRLPAGASVEDYAAAQLRLGNGAIVQLACSWKAPAGCDARIELTLFGTKGGASFRNVNGSFYDFIAEELLPDRSRRLLASPPDAWGGRAAVEWTRQLAHSPAFAVEVEHLATVAETLDRIYRRAP